MEGYFKNDEIFNTSISSLYQGKEAPGFDIFAGDSWIYPTNYPVRKYQYEIVEKALFKNSLVCLPTGMGKTFIAAVVMYNYYRWYPMGKIIFLAPTKPLVTQQIDSCFNVMGIPPQDTCEMTGTALLAKKRSLNWKTKRVFFLTPQILVNDLSSAICPPELIKCIVIDEAHKAQGNYAYCKLIEILKPYNKSFRILALSATPGSDIQAVQKVLKNLLISHIEMRSETSMELAQYTHVKKLEKIVVPLGKKLGEFKKQYLEVLEFFTRFLTRHNINLGNIEHLNKYRVLMLKDSYMKSQANPDKMIVGTFFIVITLTHGLELLELHGTQAFYNYFKEYINDPKTNPYSLMRIQQAPGFTPLINQLENELSKMELNTMDPNISFKINLDHSINQEIETINYSHPKLEKLEEIAVNHFKTFKEKNISTRIMIFCQFRISVFEICYILKRYHPLIKPMSFVGQNQNKNKQGISQKEQILIMNKFRQGGYNTLVCTCIAEEGLDIGEVDLIICFDSLSSPIRLVQRMGRTGRKREGRIVMLVTQGYEEMKFEKGIYRKNSINSLLENSTKLKEYLYKENARMIPHGIIPKCYKMNIVLPEKNEVIKKRKHNEISNYFSKNSPSKNTSLLSTTELLKLKKQVNPKFDQIVPTKFLSNLNKDELLNEFLNEKEYSLGPNNYIEWQKEEQCCSIIQHSSLTKDLVNLFSLSEVLKVNSILIKDSGKEQEIISSNENDIETKINFENYQISETREFLNTQDNDKEKKIEPNEFIKEEENYDIIDLTEDDEFQINNNLQKQFSRKEDQMSNPLIKLFNLKELNNNNKNNQLSQNYSNDALKDVITSKKIVHNFTPFIYDSSSKNKKNSKPCSKSFTINISKRDHLLKYISKNFSFQNFFEDLIQGTLYKCSEKEEDNLSTKQDNREIRNCSDNSNDIWEEPILNHSLNENVKHSNQDHSKEELNFSQEEINSLFNDSFEECEPKKALYNSEENQIENEINLSQDEINSLFNEPFTEKEENHNEPKNRNNQESISKQRKEEESLNSKVLNIKSNNESQSFLNSFFDKSNKSSSVNHSHIKEKINGSSLPTNNLSNIKELSTNKSFDEHIDMFEDDCDIKFEGNCDILDKNKKDEVFNNEKIDLNQSDGSIDMFEESSSEEVPLELHSRNEKNKEIEKSPVKFNEILEKPYLSTPLSKSRALKGIDCDLSPILLASKNKENPIKNNIYHSNHTSKINSSTTQNNTSNIKKRLIVEERQTFDDEDGENSDWDVMDLFSQSLLKKENNHKKINFEGEENQLDPDSPNLLVKNDCDDEKNLSEAGSPNLLTKNNSKFIDKFLSQRSQNMYESTRLNNKSPEYNTNLNEDASSNSSEDIDIYCMDELMGIDTSMKNKSDYKILKDERINKNKSFGLESDDTWFDFSDVANVNKLITVVNKNYNDRADSNNFTRSPDNKETPKENKTSFEIDTNISDTNNFTKSPDNKETRKENKTTSFEIESDDEWFNPTNLDIIDLANESYIQSKDQKKIKNENNQSNISHASTSFSNPKGRKLSKRSSFLLTQANQDKTLSSDDEDGGSLDDMDSSFIDSDEQNPDHSSIQNKFIHSMINKPNGKYKIPESKPSKENIYSQVVELDDSYEEDSFCVEDDDYEQEQDLSVLEILEAKLKNKKRKFVQNFPNKSSKKFKRIQIPTSESDEMDSFFEGTR